MISILLPVYNVEKYLRRCLDSIINQSYSDWELVAVDDGSTDASRSILDDYAARDNRIRVFSQRNAGLAAARNTALENMSGDYVSFVDPDDWVHPHLLSELFDFAVKNDCDITQSVPCYAYDTYGLVPKLNLNRGNGVLNRQQAMAELIEQRFIRNFVWGKLYKRTLIEGVKFPPQARFVDFEWSQNVIHACERYGYINTPLYFYLQRSDSLTGGLRSTHQLFINSLKQRLEFIEKNYPQYLKTMTKIYENYLADYLGKKTFLSRCRYFFVRVKNRLLSPYVKIEIAN
ncbi:MAG: glycosyltransferase [Muribaculaceae bacterium]|nr:glycosyltransferase [Muribaculaceae bacterium]